MKGHRVLPYLWSWPRLAGFVVDHRNLFMQSIRVERRNSDAAGAWTPPTPDPQGRNCRKITIIFGRSAYSTRIAVAELQASATQSPIWGVGGVARRSPWTASIYLSSQPGLSELLTIIFSFFHITAAKNWNYGGYERDLLRLESIIQEKACRTCSKVRWL